MVLNSMYRRLFSIIIFMFSMPILHAQHIFETAQFHIELDQEGRIIQLSNSITGHNYTPEKAKGYLVRIKKDGKEIVPQKMVFEQGILNVEFSNQVQAEIKVVEHNSYISFELQNINPAQKVDAILWGPVASTISETVGEIVGVVRNDDFAIGIQALNPKTTGGLLKNEEGAVYDRGTTATSTKAGSSLQAFTVNRNKRRTIKVWNKWKEVAIPAIEEGRLTGSKVAIFGVRPEDVLPTIGKIERQEGLPHPVVNGEWIKQSREPGRPYMISNFSESNIDTLLDYAEMAGMAGLYHEGPFETWGNFKLREEQFPNGRDGLKSIVDKAEKRGLRLGVHTLSNFITTNDRFVSPTPDTQLQEIGHSKIGEEVSANDDEIIVQTPDPFRQKTNLQTVRIGRELIRYQKVTNTKPYKLTGCVRGAFGTKKQNHSKGADIEKLMDHGYKVFFPNWNLQKELLQNLTDFFNETGVTQMDFDGHEGTYATGMGEYSLNKFAYDFYQQVDHTVANGSSRSSHFYWHMNYYLNWGEPWYGGFRESQSDYRFKNQALLDRNYMPNMLGWFLFTPTTSMEDIDWMMARAAGYDAGFAFVARPDALQNNSDTERLLQQIRIWEEARQKGVFSTEQQAKLKNPKNEFHLEKSSAKNWKLHTFTKESFTHTNKMLQPGQPTYSEWQFGNSYKSQVPEMRFLVKGKQGLVSGMSVEIDSYYELKLPVKMKVGQSLVVDDNSFAKIYDAKGRFLRKFSIEQSLPELSKGDHTLRFNCDFSSSAEAKVEVTVKVKDKVHSLSEEN